MTDERSGDHRRVGGADTGGSAAVRWLFADRATGRIVVAQMPNLLMWIFLVALAASFVVPAGAPARIVRIVEVASLALWALDELARGVNPWRRLVGAGTLAGIGVWLAW